MKEAPQNTTVEFRSKDDQILLSVQLDALSDTVWLTLNQISQLFGRDKSVISRHIKNIFETQELAKDTTVAFFATVQKEGENQVNRNLEFFNLDVILSVGYRVNSKKGTEFRRWASGVLKDCLIKGFSLNQDKLFHSGLTEVERSLHLLKQSLLTHGHITDIGSAAIEIIRSYTKSWLLLNAFDENRLSYPKILQNHEVLFTYETAINGISELKSSLMKQDEATILFGNERGNGLKQIVGSIHQTFDGALLYPSVHERAAHIFYFTIKDHPFTDGNKRIGSFFLLFYLSSYGISFNLTDEALVALALFVAQSQPSDKDIMIKLILNLIITPPL